MTETIDRPRSPSPRLVAIAVATLVGCAPPPPASVAVEPAVSASAAPVAEAPVMLGTDDLRLALGALNAPLAVLLGATRQATLEKAEAATRGLLAKAQGEDHALLEKGLDVLAGLAAFNEGQEVDRAVFDRIVALDRAWIARYPEEPWAKLWLAKTLSNMENIAVFAGFDPTRRKAEEAEAFALVHEIADRFPNDAYIQAERANVCVSERGERLDCMRRFARCLELDPKMKNCADELANLRERYVAPYCEQRDLRPGFELRIALSKVPKAWADTWKASEISVGPPFPFYVVEVAAVPMTGNAPYLRLTVPRDAWYEAIGLRSRFDANREMVVAAMDGPRLLGTMRGSAIESDGRTIDWRLAPNIERVCKKVSRRELPPDLVAK